MHHHFDYIIVGGGSAGCILAARLSEDPNVNVLLLEAGGTEIPETVENPATWYMTWGGDIDWNYQTVPQPGLDGRQTFEPRGKIIGGSSCLNLMMYIRGSQEDYDNWAYNGAPGWGYDDMLPFFQRVENQDDDSSPWAGHQGPFAVNTAAANPNPTSAAFIDACLELGYPWTDDVNGPQMEGVSWHHINVKNGKRDSLATSYLFPVLKRPNLTLESQAHAMNLIFDGKRCVGVKYSQNFEEKEVRCNREVIVAAGAMGSPQLLMLSGVGNPEHLKEHGIHVHHELPGVGENFHNHVLTGVTYECGPQVPPPTQNMSEAVMYTTSFPGWVGPDLQIAFVHASFDIIIGQAHPNSISIVPGLTRPMSRGWVRLNSSDPFDKPLINPNYLAVKADLDRLIRAIEIAREIFGSEAMSDWVTQELLPGPDKKTYEQLAAYVKSKADSYHHQCGSCKMGLDDMAVVDPELRVHGVDGLRVIDASIMPTVTSGNIHAAVLAIAEKGAHLIKTANS
ncbi:MAG: glucose-methanol-choline oxidoreductase [Ectothiorhodospiraceae bacterium]|nr:glucose-methanol-choline oxidoreductase [Ectothiorhodospiraceae bacterium]